VAINLPYYARSGDIYSQLMGQQQAAPRTMAGYYPGFTGGYDTGLYQRLRDEAAARAAAQSAAASGLLDMGGGPGEGAMGTSFGNPADAIAFGQALQGYGRFAGGMAPGGLLANLLGSGLVSAGINALGQMEANAAAQEALLESGVSAGGQASAGGPQSGGGADNAFGGEVAGAESGVSAGGEASAGGPGSGGGADNGDGFYAKGGKVTMRGLLIDETLPGPDDGYAALQAGEYVIKKSTTKKLGDKKLKALNEGRASIKMSKE